MEANYDIIKESSVGYFAEKLSIYMKRRAGVKQWAKKEISISSYYMFLSHIWISYGMGNVAVLLCTPILFVLGLVFFKKVKP